MVVVVLLVVMASGLSTGFYLAGHSMGRRRALDMLDEDVHLRREVLEHLAQVENMKLVGRE